MYVLCMDQTENKIFLAGDLPAPLKKLRPILKPAGECLCLLLDSTVHHQPGKERRTSSFRKEGLWDKIIKNVIRRLCVYPVWA